MNPRPDYTAADAERARRALQRDPAASGYGAYLREKRNGMCPIARETERVRILMALHEARD